MTDVVLWGLCAVLVGLLGLLPVGSATAAETADKVPTIALLLPATGERARLGEQLMDAARLGAEGVGVRVEHIDEGETVEEMLEALAGLARREDLVAVIGPLSSRRARSAAHQAQRMGVPLVLFSGAQDVEQVGDLVFRARMSPEEQARQVATTMAEQMGWTTLGILAPRTDFGDQVVAGLVDGLLQQGGAVRALGRYEPGTTDFRPPLEALVGSRVFLGRGRGVGSRRADRHGTLTLSRRGQIHFEALLIADSHEVVARLLPFLPRVGIQTGGGGEGTGVQLVGLPGWRGDGLQRAGDHALGAIFFDTYGGETEGGLIEEFARSFEDRYGREATAPEAEIYDLVGMLGSALGARQEGESVQDAALARLRQPRSYPGVTGSWSFGEHGEPVRALRPFRVVDGGRWVRHGGGQ